MPRQARVHLVPLKSSLVNLPLSLYGPLLERNVRPQHLTVVLTEPNRQPKKDIYVGWTGMLAASSVSRLASSSSTSGPSETVEIDPQFAGALGLAQGHIVEVALIHDLPRAKSVQAEPLSADDWEIIELDADHVENTLLSQVRVAAPNQEINVWVRGQTRVRLRITALDPPNTKALLLSTDTELAIAPVLRRISQPAAESSAISKTKSTLSSAQPVSSATSKQTTSSSAFSTILRVLPTSLISALPEAGEEPLACVSPSLITSPKLLKAPAYSAVIALLKPPPDPEDTATSTASASSPEPKHLDLSKDGVSKIESKSSEPTPIPIFPLKGIPEGHIVIVGGTSNRPGEPSAWDRVRLIIQPASCSAVVPEIIDRGGPGPTHQLAGIDPILKSAADYFRAAFALQKHGRTSSLHALLITGRVGAGKTEVARAIARGLQTEKSLYAYSRYIDLSRYRSNSPKSLTELFNFWRSKAAWHAPAILILDNIDAVLAAESEHADSFRSRHATESFLAVFTRAAASGVVLLATAQSEASLHAALGAAHAFKKIIALKAPAKDARKQIIEHVIKERLVKAEGLAVDDEDPVNATAIATETEGYSATDLRDLVGRAIHLAAARSAASNSFITLLTSSDFVKAKKDFVPLSLRDIPLQTSTVAWADIGGLSETRQVLRETLEWPTKYGAIFRQSPLRLRSGLLLYGYPGCGKTMLASAVAKECGLNFVSVKGPELLNKYIGASEKSVRDIFERASAAKPCVLFFDEFDSIAPKRGHDSTGVTDRVVNQLLTLMDGAEGLDGVYVLAATSRPDLIDSALLRPGRLDKSLLCNMPTAAERKEILEAHARKLRISHNLDFTPIAEAAEGFSGADLQALIYNAHLALVHEDLGVHASLAEGNPGRDDNNARVQFVSFGKGSEDSGRVRSRAEEGALQRRLQKMMSTNTNRSPVSRANAPDAPTKKQHELTQSHLLNALRDARPSVSRDEVARLSRIYSAFVDGRSGEMPVPPDAGGVGQRATLM